MQINKENKIEKIASKDSTRPGIQDPYMQKEGDKAYIIATDDRALAKVEVKLDDGDTEGYVPVQAIKDARKTRLPILLNGRAEIPNGVSFERDKESRFPNVNQVFPKGDIQYEITLDAAKLKDIAEALGKDSVTLTFRKPLDPVEVKANDKGVGLLMPMKTR